ncbi:hypothetical protein DPX16_16079 [Anabarilius grahami]|uniref:Uncharacterized protein n=1 Tax=Anabarilius grahami TaxID=495550 RepID=A0A3N0YU71_ANAGA|nr:hypothetical protein DPX16_16079 [Anabarilius grahami]
MERRKLDDRKTCVLTTARSRTPQLNTDTPPVTHSEQRQASRLSFGPVEGLLLYNNRYDNFSTFVS